MTVDKRCIRCVLFHEHTTMKDLHLVSNKEQEDFFNSFDHVLCDVDGVLWLFLETIPGTQNGIKALKKLGKKVTFVSNNCTKSLNFYYNQLKSAGFELDREDIITPALAMIAYLKKQNVSNEIYLMGTIALRKQLEKGGFTVAAPAPDRIEETVTDLARHSIVDDKNIGVVIADADINLNYVKLQKAATYLKRPEVLFITGATDSKLPVGLNHVLIGPGYFHKILEDISGRKPYPLAKPSPYLNDYIVEKLKIKDHSRVLFIGDSIPEDMGFAANCGYKKLLVLSGLTKMNSIDNWQYPEHYKPDYYVKSLKTIDDVVSENFPNKL